MPFKIGFVSGRKKPPSMNTHFYFIFISPSKLLNSSFSFSTKKLFFYFLAFFPIFPHLLVSSLL
ncbi:unnamed protein product [Meloidogyne enterolobii]|uniref:Uncharacterized protein n=1 Tax=Meloidogyne enterolobii TaxID=390850 RepID=A0ACB1AEX3_MELEN